MSKPVFMRLHQGGVEIAVNMSLVGFITPNSPSLPTDKSVLYFAFQIREGEPAYLVVDEPLDEIAKRKEWHE